MTDEKAPFHRGDHVRHQPTGEEWIILRSGQDGWVEPAGWPPCRGRASDCTLIETVADRRAAGKKILVEPDPACPMSEEVEERAAEIAALRPSSKRWVQYTICEGCGKEDLLHNEAVWTTDGASYCPNCCPEIAAQPIIEALQAATWLTDASDLGKAAAEFERKLPGWWWSVGMCGVGAHASCAVDASGPAAHLLEGIEQGHPYDDGFHVDTDKGQPAEALRAVMRQALGFMEGTGR